MNQKSKKQAIKSIDKKANLKYLSIKQIQRIFINSKK